MCEGCGCRRPTPPANSASAGPVMACDQAASELLLSDELGLPFAQADVTLELSGQRHNARTDANGKLCLRVPPGQAVRVTLADTHERRAGDATRTPSGQHFAVGGSGP